MTHYHHNIDAVPGVVPLEVLKPNVVCDIDGVLANCEHRLHYILGEKQSWDEFDRFTPYDTPIWPTILLINLLSMQGFNIILLTGRGDRVFEQTVTWLEHYQVRFNELIMRTEGDRRPAWKVKKDVLHNRDLTPDNVFAIFEDEPETVATMRKTGFLVYDPLEWREGWQQVNEGGKDHDEDADLERVDRAIQGAGRCS